MLIEYIYPSINKDLVFHGKNIGVCAISIFTVASIYYDWNITILAYMLTFHSIIDLPFSVPDVVLHHLFVLCGTIALIIHGDVCEKQNQIFASFCWAEISTIFLCNGDSIAYILKNTEIQHYDKYKSGYYSTIKSFFTSTETINNLIFVALFMKLRIYDYTIAVFDDETFMSTCFVSTSFVWMKNINIVGLYSLNLYWGNLIIKKVYKTYFINSDNDYLETIMINSPIKDIFIGIYSYMWFCHIVNLGFFFRSPTILNEITVGYVLYNAYIIKPMYRRTAWLNYLIMIAYIMYFSMNFITEFISTQLTSHFNKNEALLF